MLLVNLQFFKIFALLAVIVVFDFLEPVDLKLKLFTLLADLSDLFFGLALLLLQINFILLILVFVLLEGFNTVIQLFFFHDDVLLEQFCLFSFVSD